MSDPGKAMPTTSPPELEKAADSDVALWRYMGFEKYMWMLQNQMLFFTRADQFADRYEGSTTKETMHALQQSLAPGSIIEGLIPLIQAIRQDLRRFYYVNCWHKNRGESAAMWNLYALSNKGVAIRSNLRRLRQCVPEAFVDEVQYIDYTSGVIPTDMALRPYLYKRLSFKHEHEVRAVLAPAAAYLGLKGRR